MVQFQLKPISPSAIPEALEKVERYRLLNEPSEAQSICEDILRIDPDNQEVLVMLLLSITDQFEEGAASVREARQIIPRLETPYQRAYYAGIISERSAKAVLRSGVPGANFTAYEELEEAMHRFEEAETLRPEGNDDAILRWNTCARILMKNQSLRPRPEEKYHEVLGE
jgi:tetratricopeptide (TPR) repeat protein